MTTPSPESDAPPLAVVLSNANGGNAPEGRPVQGCMACATYRHGVLRPTINIREWNRP